MKVISIGNDPKLFDRNSSVAKRQVEYGEFLEELHVFSRRGGKNMVKLSPNVFVYPLSLGEISKLLKKGEYVVSTQDPFEHGVLSVWLKMRYGVRLQVQLHTDFNNKYFLLSSPLNFIRFFLAHLVLPYADSVRVVSHKVKESIKDLNKNVTVLPITIDGSKQTVDSSKRRTQNQKILTVARLEKEKDLETAIKAFAEISTKFPDASFTIVGDGSQRKKLELLAKSLELEDKINFAGWQNDLSPFYSSHSIYISTSLFEGYGMSMVEAAHNGLALVLSDAGVAGELPALISKPRDVGSFAKSLEKLLGDANLTSKMGEEARAEAFKMVVDKQTYLSRYKESLEKTVSNNSGFVKAVFRGNKILRFIVAGGTAASSQIILLFIFTDIFKIWYLYSSILSFVIALVISFLLQKFWAFRDKGTEMVHIQFFKYTLVAVSGLVFNTALMYLWVSILDLWYILAQIVTGVVIAVYNFLMYRKFIFKS